MSRGVETIDRSKQRKPRRTPWAIYNPQWIKSWERGQPKTPKTRRATDGDAA